MLFPGGGAWLIFAGHFRIADSHNRNLLAWTQAAAAVQSLALAALTLTHVITLWEIIALTAFQGLINAFDMPGR